MIEVRQHFINGERVDGTSGRFSDIDPDRALHLRDGRRPW